MRDNLSIVIAMLVFVILVVIFPLYNYFERQDDMSYNLALKATTNFVDEVLETGYLTQEMYDNYINVLGDTGNIYNIQLEAHRKILVEEVDNSGKGKGVFDEKYLINYNNNIFEVIDEAEKADKDITNINDRVLKDGAYYFNQGDQFYVKMKNSNTTMAGAIFNTIVPTASKDRIVVNYGGIIKNQAWEKVDAKFYGINPTIITEPRATLIYGVIEKGGTEEVITYLTENAEINLKEGDKLIVYNGHIEEGKKVKEVRTTFSKYNNGNGEETLNSKKPAKSEGIEKITEEIINVNKAPYVIKTYGGDINGAEVPNTDVTLTINVNSSEPNLSPSIITEYWGNKEDNKNYYYFLLPRDNNNTAYYMLDIKIKKNNANNQTRVGNIYLYTFKDEYYNNYIWNNEKQELTDKAGTVIERKYKMHSSSEQTLLYRSFSWYYDGVLKYGGNKVFMTDDLKNLQLEAEGTYIIQTPKDNEQIEEVPNVRVKYIKNGEEATLRIAIKIEKYKTFEGKSGYDSAQRGHEVNLQDIKDVVCCLQTTGEANDIEYIHLNAYNTPDELDKEFDQK